MCMTRPVCVCVSARCWMQQGWRRMILPCGRSMRPLAWLCWLTSRCWTSTQQKSMLTGELCHWDTPLGRWHNKMLQLGFNSPGSSQKYFFLVNVFTFVWNIQMWPIILQTIHHNCFSSQTRNLTRDSPANLFGFVRVNYLTGAMLNHRYVDLL